MTTITADTALFADATTRTLRGLLIPWDQISHPTVSGEDPIMFSRGSVEIPVDVTVLNANRLHSQFKPVARFTKAEDSEIGLIAHFEVAKGPEGDQLLAEASDPDPTKRPKLSAEVAGLVRSGIRAVKARLTGAAFVPQGAFEAAALFAISTDDADKIVALVNEAVTAALATLTDPPAPADPTTQGGTMTAAAAPATATAPAHTTPAPGSTPDDGTTADGLFAALAHYGKSKDKSVLEQFAGSDVLFAISNIQNDGPSGRTIAADVRVPQFVGELWKRRRYQRRYIPLFRSAALTALRITGWRWTTEPEVGDYSGNATEIPSNAVDTEPVGKDARRLAGGHKLDRRYIDFGDTTVYSSYFDKMTESYSRKSDLRILTDAVAAATAVDVSALEIPAGVAAGLAAIVDGALAVIEAENTPTASIVSSELWRDIVLTGKNEVLGYLSASLGLEEGQMAGFKILPGPAATVGAGKVLTVAQEALTVYELGGGTPIRVEGIDPHHGAIDPALFGYCDSLVEASAALALVDTAVYGTD